MSHFLDPYNVGLFCFFFASKPHHMNLFVCLYLFLLFLNGGKQITEELIYELTVCGVPLRAVEKMQGRLALARQLERTGDLVYSTQIIHTHLNKRSKAS